MFKMTLKVAAVEVDVRLYTVTLTKIIKAALRQAARRFVRAAIVAVPVDSGMARGSFLNFKKVLGGLAIPISPRRTGLTYYGPPRLPKTPESGASLATQPEDIFYETPTTFGFHYSNTVLHYNINEFFPKIESGPWFSYEKGQAAAMRYLRERLPKIIPAIKDFLIVTTISGGPNGITRHVSRPSPKSADLGADI